MLGVEGGAGAAEVVDVRRVGVQAHVSVRLEVHLLEHRFTGIGCSDVGSGTALEGGAWHAEATIFLWPEDLRPGIGAEDGPDEVGVGLIVGAEGVVTQVRRDNLHEVVGFACQGDCREALCLGRVALRNLSQDTHAQDDGPEAVHDLARHERLVMPDRAPQRDDA